MAQAQTHEKIGLEVIDVQGSAQNAVVIVEGDSLDEVRSGEARRLAIEHASSVLGRCGFNKFGDMSYVCPDGKVLTTDEDLCSDARVPGGRYRQNIKISST